MNQSAICCFCNYSTLAGKEGRSVKAKKTKKKKGSAWKQFSWSSCYLAHEVCFPTLVPPSALLGRLNTLSSTTGLLKSRVLVHRSISVYHQYWGWILPHISIWYKTHINGLWTLMQVMCVHHSQMLAFGAVTWLKTENHKADFILIYLLSLKLSSLA